MKKYPLLRRTLAVGIILFFIGVAFAPSINYTVVKASNDNDLVELTTHAYSITGEITHTIHLTKRQLREVQRVFETLKDRLSTSESMVETQQVFNDTIVSLSRYNLLPHDMSIKQIKRFVRSTSSNSLVVPFLQKTSTTSQSDLGVIQNSLCYVAGNTSNIHFAKLAKRTSLRLYNIMDYCSGNAPLVKLATAFWIVCNQFSILSDLVLKQPWRHYGASIYFGNYHYYPYPNWLSPAQGWISTNGMNGKQNISGSFWGQKMIGGWQPQDDWYMNYTWRGCVGFTGLITYIGSDSAYFLGSALSVNIGPNRP